MMKEEVLLSDAKNVILVKLKFILLVRIIIIIIIVEREREQIRTRIAELEAITNRTPEQEQELQNLKEKLVKLEQQQEGGFKKYLP